MALAPREPYEGWKVTSVFPDASRPVVLNKGSPRLISGCWHCGMQVALPDITLEAESYGTSDHQLTLGSKAGYLPGPPSGEEWYDIGVVEPCLGDPAVFFLFRKTQQLESLDQIK